MRRLFMMVASAGLLTACQSTASTTASSSASSSPTSQPPSARSSITVFAAASLTESFDDIGRSFEADHPGARVVFNFGSSSELAAQINEGAPADVFAAADDTAMTRALDGLESPADPTVFASNSAEIAVEPGNPQGIHSVADLANPQLIVVMCAPDVPCGRYANEILQRARVDVQPASLEPNVKSVASKVALGEADAGLVYHSDIVGSQGKIDGVEIPAADNVIADYPIVALNAVDPNAATATAFIKYVLGPKGQAILQAHGFTPHAELDGAMRATSEGASTSQTETTESS